MTITIPTWLIGVLFWTFAATIIAAVLGGCGWLIGAMVVHGLKVRRIFWLYRILLTIHHLKGPRESVMGYLDCAGEEFVSEWASRDPDGNNIRKMRSILAKAHARKAGKPRYP